MVTPPDVTELELEPGHPGLGDEEYIRRRKELFALCRKHRLENLGPPLIQYDAEETRIWREVAPKLHELHDKYACAMYLRAKNDLAITESHCAGSGSAASSSSHRVRSRRHASSMHER